MIRASCSLSACVQSTLHQARHRTELWLESLVHLILRVKMGCAEQRNKSSLALVNTHACVLTLPKR